MASPDLDAPRRWRERIWFARLLRAIIVLTPLVASFAFAYWMSHTLPIPDPFAARQRSAPSGHMVALLVNDGQPRDFGPVRRKAGKAGKVK